MMMHEAERQGVKGMTANVERSSTSGTCDDWRKTGEHKRSMSRRHEETEKRENEEEDERVWMAPNIRAGGSQLQATSRRERNTKGWMSRL